MINQKTVLLINKLINHFLCTSDTNLIQSCTRQACILLNTKVSSQIKPASFWERNWKTIVSEEKRSNISSCCKSIPKYSLPMLKIINCLKFSLKNKWPKENEYNNLASEKMTESEIIDDLIFLLQGGDGNCIHIKDFHFQVDKVISQGQKYIIQPILKIILSLHSIRHSQLSQYGLIGQALYSHFENEIQTYIFRLSSLPKMTSLLELLAFSQSAYSNNILNLTFLHNSLMLSYQAPKSNQISKHENALSLLFKVLNLGLNHGNPYIRKFSKQLLDSSVEIEVEFIRDWVVSGELNDPFNEFFITSANEKLKYSQWWNSRFFLVHDKIPQILISNSTPKLINQILSSGRAWNFVRKFRKNSTISIPHWKNGIFRLDMVEIFAKDAMDALMSFIKNDLWIQGYFKVFYEFILFGRGDFSSTLYHLFTNNIHHHDCVTILHESLEIVGKYVSRYTNPLNSENLLNYIDLKISNVENVEVQNVALVYKIRHPIDVVFDELIIMNYYRLSRLIWRTKCIEMELMSGWNFKDGAKFLEILGADISLDQLITCQSFIILQVIHQICEYICSDVIYYSWLKFQKSLESVNNFDELFSIHREYLNRMIHGALIEDEDTENELGEILITSEQFLNEIKKYRRVFISILKAAQSPDFENNEAEIIEDLVSQLENIRISISQIHENLSKHLRILYQIIKLHPEDDYYSSFISRLHSCLISI